MTFGDYQRLCPRPRVQDEIAYACEYLEARGLEFGVDFGISSAVRGAATTLCLELEMEAGYGWGV